MYARGPWRCVGGAGGQGLGLVSAGSRFWAGVGTHLADRSRPPLYGASIRHSRPPRPATTWAALVAAGQLGSYLLSAAAARRMLERSAGAQTRAKRDRSTRRSTCCGRVCRIQCARSVGLDVPPSTRRPYGGQATGGFPSAFAKAMARAGAPGFPPHESNSFSVPVMSLEDLRRSKGES